MSTGNINLPPSVLEEGQKELMAFDCEYFSCYPDERLQKFLIAVFLTMASALHEIESN